MLTIVWEEPVYQRTALYRGCCAFIEQRAKRFSIIKKKSKKAGAQGVVQTSQSAIISLEDGIAHLPVEVRYANH
ncbi:hypothetical protein A4V01_13960 [Erysipelotrichaceae bacterium I46]|nr:hypothetical protein A4V01_13960 [Erysipelotrichaceae bacterium I46]ASU17611.1 hypothetical protein ADH65_03405 [[Clostridium] innocuum]